MITKSNKANPDNGTDGSNTTPGNIVPHLPLPKSNVAMIFNSKKDNDNNSTVTGNNNSSSTSGSDNNNNENKGHTRQLSDSTGTNEISPRLDPPLISKQHEQILTSYRKNGSNPSPIGGHRTSKYEAYVLILLQCI